MKIGAKIQFYNLRMREERKRQGISQEQLAEMVGETITTIQFVETLRQPTRSLNRISMALPKIASALCVDLEYLFPDDYLMALQKKYLPRQTTLTVSREVGMDAITGGEQWLYLPPPDEDVRRLENTQLVQKLLAELPEKERLVLDFLYGLSAEDGEKKTLKECGVKFGVSKERIRQIEANAMLRLRRMVRTSGHFDGFNSE